MIVPFPYFDGPSDGSALRDYLNRLVRYINLLSAIISLSSVTRTVSASSPSADKNVQLTDGTILLDGSAGNFTVHFQPSLGTIEVIFIKTTDAGTITIDDGVTPQYELNMLNQAIRVRSTGSVLYEAGQSP